MPASEMLLGMLVMAALAPSEQSCVAPGTGSFDMYMPYHNVTVTVPEVPTTVSQYAYATENALVAVPKACFDKYKTELNATASNLNDKTGGPAGMYYFRISKPAVEYAILGKMGDCACGLVVALHGTGGVTWSTPVYATMMAGMGYVVVLPDSHAQPASMGLKGKGPLKNTSQIDMSNQCGANNPYEGSCGGFSKPFCYSTKTANVLNDPATYKKYVERNYLIRKLEVDYFVENQGALLGAFSKVFLLGRSEGGMTASRYYHASLDAKLSGVIIASYSCEWSYFTSCAQNAKICGDQCIKTVPQLNVIGDHDHYFGNYSGSISYDVADASNGYGGPITGNCRAAYDAQSFTKSTVVVFPGVDHSLMYSHGNALRSVFADFLATPTAAASTWGSLTRTGCSLADGVYTCDDEAATGKQPCTGYSVNTNSSWVFSGATETCPSSGATTTAGATSPGGASGATTGAPSPGAASGAESRPSSLTPVSLFGLVALHRVVS